MSHETLTQPVREIPGDFKAKIDAAGRKADEIRGLVADAVDRGIRNVFLVGCGGSLFGFGYVKVLLDRSPIPVYTFNSDELINRNPSVLGSESLVIISSTNGTTAETARAAEFVTALGATVIGLTQDPDSLVGKACPQLILHQGVEAKQITLALIGWSLLDVLGAAPEYDEVVRSLATSSEAFEAAIHESDEQFNTIARQLHTEDIIYVLGSGPLEPAAQVFAMCYLQEMQWKHAVAVGSGEFLHGAFEVTTPDLSVIVLTAEDSTRPMGDRVLKFLRRYGGDKVHHVDAANLSLPGVSPTMRPMMGTLIMDSTLVGRLAEHFEAWSGHSLKERRYMWKIEY